MAGCYPHLLSYSRLFMTGECLRLLTWNVSGLHARFTDLHSYVLTHRSDFIALQEVGPLVPGFRSYEDWLRMSVKGRLLFLRKWVLLGH